MIERLAASRSARQVVLFLATWSVVGPWIYSFVRSPMGVIGLVAADLNIYLDATRNWLASGQWYLERQLHGPYVITYGDVLYPPHLLYLTVPFTVLPQPIWWLVPLGVLTWAIRRLGPRPWAWPLMVACLIPPLTMQQFVKGNPVMWVMAAEAAWLARGWPTLPVLLKPSLGPFALIGVTRRGWWAQLVVAGLATLPVLGLALMYPEVILDSRGGGALYSVRDVPLMLIPILAAVRAGPWRLVDGRGRTVLVPITLQPD